MNGNGISRRNLVVAVSVVLIVSFLVPALVAATDARKAEIWSTNSCPYGKSFAQWTAEWWKWAIAIPAPSNPLNDPTGGHAAVGQSGPVWFLPGYSDGATPKVTIPASKAILFPIVNAECSTVEPEPFNGRDERDLRRNAKRIIDEVPKSSLKVVIDGWSVNSAASYRAGSDLFTVRYPTSNILGVTGPGTAQSVSDGYWILLAPLPVGTHTIHIEGRFGPLLGSYAINTTYTVKVVR